MDMQPLKKRPSPWLLAVVLLTSGFCIYTGWPALRDSFSSDETKARRAAAAIHGSQDWEQSRSSMERLWRLPTIPEDVLLAVTTDAGRCMDAVERSQQDYGQGFGFILWFTMVAKKHDAAGATLPVLDRVIAYAPNTPLTGFRYLQSEALLAKADIVRRRLESVHAQALDRLRSIGSASAAAAR
jgi:hypothetical protein